MPSGVVSSLLPAHAHADEDLDEERAERTALLSRSSGGAKPVVAHADTGKPAPQRKPGPIAGIPFGALVSGVCYCSASASMVLLNKHALASFSFTAPNALLCFQCVLAVILVKLCEAAGFVKLQPLKPKLIGVWFPVNLIFVAMLGTGFYALKEMGIGMFSVWKQLANLTTALGDLFIFKKTYPWPVWACLSLMIASAVVGASTDSRFTWVGYSWQIANCLFTSAYALHLRSVMDRVTDYTTDGGKMDEFSMVYYNNLLSIPPILVLMWFFGEYEGLMAQTALRNPSFQMVAMVGGVLGFAISFSSLWFLSQTTATIYSLIGSLNKIPIAIVGMLAFAEPTNPKNLSSIVIGLGAGVMFTQYKSKK
ncbi:hypothetical protein CHLRE_12g490050v5 [Chlamydomonas reinhardtii]|uniref:Sugar phosphate transporter domain-containing protein n=1 Tax=Chlamydomonas reinhardtii TaxID=3055 RepID=A8ILL9_CHLRE|nr:uncharacterized protein CHLRE_12g490050v5 [Chlamydomonas reinhardtii]PNW74619.1 hypothetical protein CHLRE_12g490050v5 [Chlamydomonas reinhardtii]|eukprot:XP_001690932.1 GDP-Mannose transporter, golgi apparatus [Chlamydomonas reinhardtii]